MTHRAATLAWLLLPTLLAVASVDPTLEVRNVEEQVWKPFRVEARAQVLFFLSTECPISRFYASEIRRMCSVYASKGVQCGLVFEDLPLSPASVRQHLQEFGYRNLPAAIDVSHRIARQAGAPWSPRKPSYSIKRTRFDIAVASTITTPTWESPAVRRHSAIWLMPWTRCLRVARCPYRKHLQSVVRFRRIDSIGGST